MILERNILFLQANSSPVIKRLAKELSVKDIGVISVHFCLGDQLLWGAHNATQFRDKFEDWPHFLKNLCHKHRITDMVFFGKDRPYHRIARDIARENSIKVFMFDEGLIRPNWITIDTESYNELGEKLELFETHHDEIVPTVEVREFFFLRLFMDTIFHIANIIGKPIYSNYKSHRSPSFITEARGQVRNWFRKTLFFDPQLLELFLEAPEPFFLLPLQLETDYQIIKHSPFNSIEEYIDLTFNSFSKHAPPDSRLLVKQHPLDNGIINFNKVAYELAERYSLTERVHFVEGGDILSIISRSTGVVTINSTVGMTALQHLKPVKVLGSAIYDIEGLTEPRHLDSFWNAPFKPKKQNVEKFASYLKTTKLANGGYFSKHGISLAIQGALERILSTHNDMPNQ